MEEQALYRAILAAPHDDTARLVYADWLDENADRFPEPLARVERGRAELIRVQCAIARSGPGGWKAPDAPVAATPELVKRQKRLRFLYSAKLRRGLPSTLAGQRFDRGFLRPLLHVRPQDFLRDPVPAPGPLPVYDPLPPVPADHPMRRYIPADDPFAAFPLWDVHLYAWSAASPYATERADHGQYGELLARCARSPSLERVGWLKVSFFQTSTVEFLRTGHFPNVETLVLNCVPFPDVLEAVAENESFRSLRYITFGPDLWAWCVSDEAVRRGPALWVKLDEVNKRHLPHGEMLTALRAILRDTPIPPPPPPPPPEPVINWTPAIGAAAAPRPTGDGALVLLGLAAAVSFVAALQQTLPPPEPRQPEIPFQRMDAFQFDSEKFKKTQKLLDDLNHNKGVPASQRRDGPEGQRAKSQNPAPEDRPPVPPNSEPEKKE